MAVQEVILKTNPAGPVEYAEKAIKKALDASYLIADTKMDGVQLNLVIGLDGVGLFTHWLSRAGKCFPALAAETDGQGGAGFCKLLDDDSCIYPDGFMLQAEIICPGQTAEETAGNLRRIKVTRKDPKPLLTLADFEVHVFGVVPLNVVQAAEDHDVTHAIMKYHVEAMTALLQKHVPQIAWKVVETVDVFTYEELQRVYGVRREEGQEGLVLKDPLAIWKRGKKTGQWKMKPEDTIDGIVQGLIWGTPGLGNEGKVIGFEVLLEDGHVVNACGLTQAQKEEFTEAVTEWERLDKQTGGLHVTPKPYIDWAVEVSFMERFKDGSLRHPSFSRWRGISDPKVKE